MIRMKKLFILTTILGSLFFSSTVSAKRTFLIPKFAFNFPVKGGDPSFGLGGGLGYWVHPMVTLETTYLRVLGSGDSPDNHIVEFDTVVSRSMGKLNFLMQAGSGFYKISDPNLDTGITAILNAGVGLGINFIPTLNVRGTAIYYSLFSHADLFSVQISLILNL